MTTTVEIKPVWVDDDPEWPRNGHYTDLNRVP
jgi:hypothetical protein